MRELLKKELTKLAKKTSLATKYLDNFIHRLNHSSPLTRDEGAVDHFCSFYIPIDRKAKKLYEIIHNKTGLWMPPGGHIDKGETPLQAMYREALEELRYDFTPDKAELFTISITPIDNPKQPQCKAHYDLWYLIDTKMYPYAYNTEELGGGMWMTKSEALKKVTFPIFNPIIKSILL